MNFPHVAAIVFGGVMTVVFVKNVMNLIKVILFYKRERWNFDAQWRPLSPFQVSMQKMLRSMRVGTLVISLYFLYIYISGLGAMLFLRGLYIDLGQLLRNVN